MKKNSEAAERTRLDIAEAYIQIAGKMSADKIHVNSVAAKSGYSRQTFYRHFDNIFDLQNFANKLIRPIIQVTPNEMRRLPYERDIERGTRKGIEFLEDNLKKMRLACTLESRKKLEEDFINMMTGVYAKACGQISERNAELAKLLLSYHLNGVLHMFFDYANNPEKLSIEEVARLFAELHHDGVFVIHSRLVT